MRFGESWARSRSRSKSNRFVEHNARFESATVHYTATFQLAGKVDIARASRRLLKADLALAAAWPSESVIRVPKRLQRLARPLNRARSMTLEYQRAASAGTWKAVLRLTSKHPKIGLMHLRALMAPRAAEDLEKFIENMKFVPLILFLLKHPVVGFRHVLPNIHFTRTSKKTGSPEQPILVPDGTDPDFDSVPLKVTDEEAETLRILDEAERVVLDQQLVAAAERAIDSTLFGGRNHDEDCFVRLTLRSSYHHFSVPGTEIQQHVVFEPRLLLHESGAVQLSVALRTEGPLSTDQILDLMYSPDERIVRSELAEPLLRGSGWEGRLTEWSNERDAGARLGIVAHPEKVSMHDLLFAHIHAVTRVIRHGYTFWTIYPVAIVVPDTCCKPTEWRKKHREDVLRIALRSMSATRVAKHVPNPPDFSLRADHSLFANMGSAAYFQWEGEPPFGIGELDTVLVIEYALLLYVRLQTMETQVARMTLGERKLRERYRNAILLFSELRQGNLRAGETRIIVAHMLEEMGANHIRPTIESALELAGMAHATVSDAKAARRSWWITLVATVIGFVVAVPSVSQLLDSAKGTTPAAGEEWLVVPLKQFAAIGFWGPWAVLGSISGALIFIWFANWLWRNRPRSVPGRRRGFAWPTQIAVEIHDEEEDTSSSSSKEPHARETSRADRSSSEPGVPA